MPLGNLKRKYCRGNFFLRFRIKEAESPTEITGILKKMNFDPFLDFDDDDVNNSKLRL